MTYARSEVSRDGESGGETPSMAGLLHIHLLTVVVVVVFVIVVVDIAALAVVVVEINLVLPYCCESPSIVDISLSRRWDPIW